MYKGRAGSEVGEKLEELRGLAPGIGVGRRGAATRFVVKGAADGAVVAAARCRFPRSCGLTTKRNSLLQGFRLRGASVPEGRQDGEKGCRRVERNRGLTIGNVGPVESLSDVP